MSAAVDLPAWAAILTALLTVAGAGMTLIGSIGLVRLSSFYERMHAPTLGTSAGTACIALASMICFTVLGSRPVIHEILILVFVTATTPVTLVMLSRAAVHRDRAEGNEQVPPPRAGSNPNSGSDLERQP